MIKPNYQSGNIVNLMASINAAFGNSPMHYSPLPTLSAESLGTCKNLVLMMIDGLGYNFLCKYGAGGHLHRHLLQRLDSVFPTTTTAAVTTFKTGLAPQQHALTGWNTWIPEAGSIIQVLPYQTRSGHLDLNENLQLRKRLFQLPSFHQQLGLEHSLVMPDNLIHSTYSAAFSGNATLFPYRGMEDFFIQTAMAVRQQKAQYVYSYWPMLDTLGHQQGIHAAQTLQHFRQLDEAFGRFLENSAGTGTTVIVTGDHGMVDTTKNSRLKLENHPHLKDTLALPLCGEPRAAFCYVRPFKLQQFEEYVNNELHDCVHAIRSEDLVKEGYFGLGAPHPCLQQRIGDYTLIMKGNYTLHDQLTGEDEKQFIGMHGGLHEDELHVPLIIASVE